MRLVLVILILACIAIQYPLHLGEFGYKRIDVLNQQLQEQRETNRAMIARNNAMQAEIDDLTTGTQALEDYARSEMSMIERDEVLVRILPDDEDASVTPIRLGVEHIQEPEPTPTNKPSNTAKPSAPKRN